MTDGKVLPIAFWDRYPKCSMELVEEQEWTNANILRGDTEKGMFVIEFSIRRIFRKAPLGGSSHRRWVRGGLRRGDRHACVVFGRPPVKNLDVEKTGDS